VRHGADAGLVLGVEPDKQVERLHPAARLAHPAGELGEALRLVDVLGQRKQQRAPGAEVQVDRLFGGFLLLGGRLADFLGRRRMYVIGLGLFALASLAGALAQSALWLVIARGAQGLGAALVSPAALALLMTLFKEGAERNRALGLWAALGGSGGAAGAILGGALTDGLGWEAVLLVNLPIGALAMALAPRLLPESRMALGRRAFDVAGALAVTAGLTLLVYSIVDANAAGWGSVQTVGLGALALVVLAGFVAIELRSPQPLVPLRFFRNRALRGGNLVTILNTGALFPMFFFVTLYTQNVLGYSPIESGLAQLRSR
jgi:MFS family permease